MDQEKLDHSGLMKQIAEGIKNSRIFVCCVTKEYSESASCNTELSFAGTHKKPRLILMLDQYDKLESAVQFMIELEAR